MITVDEVTVTAIIDAAQFGAYLERYEAIRNRITALEAERSGHFRLAFTGPRAGRADALAGIAQTTETINRLAGLLAAMTV